MIEKLRKMIEDCENIVFFGGAGVSTESGIPDFRSVDGLYEQVYKFPPEVMLSHRFFLRHTADFFDFYRSKMLYPQAEPNQAHIALAALEKQGKLREVITQNIDGLHQKAGSDNVLELHGSVHRNYCMECHKFYGLAAILHSQGIPKCTCGGVIKPDVVLYEEGLDSEVMRRAVAAIAQADMLIIGGTSLAVYPAAGLIDYYKGHKLVLINKTATAANSRADLVLEASIGSVLGGIVK